MVDFNSVTRFVYFKILFIYGTHQPHRVEVYYTPSSCKIKLTFYEETSKQVVLKVGIRIDINDNARFFDVFIFC